MELGLNGKIAFVTGASRGIGAAIAMELVREGVHVCLVARDLAKLNEVAAALRDQANVHAAVHEADLIDPAAAQGPVRSAIDAFGQLDILLNNAGATKRADCFALSEEDWQDGFALKFHGYVRMTRAAWSHLRNVKVNIGIRDGVRVNAINPGLIETGRFTRNIERTTRNRSCSRDEAIAYLPSTRGTTCVGQPDETGAMTAFLASNKAGFPRGSIIDVDGGATRSL